MSACQVELADPQLIRYSRHIMLPQIDLAGQQALLGARVLMIGAGGLGAPASLYLAAAGVGELTICDGDSVDLTNLQRQIVHREVRVGQNKAESAATALAEINPDCRVVVVPHRVEADELLARVAEADVVVDCSDNFPTRHAINVACVRHAKPLVSGAGIRFSGQLSVFDTRHADAPCYRCLFPDVPAADAPIDDADRCAVMGVFAPLTGIIGTAQAAETIRLIVSGTSPLIGQLVLFDAIGMDWQKIRVPRDPSCPVCGHRPSA